MDQRRFFGYAILSVVLIVVAVAAWRLFNPVNEPVEQTDLQRSQAVILRKSKMQFLGIMEASSIPATELPQIVQDLLPSDATEVRSQKLTEQGGYTGYMVSFQLAQPLRTAMNIMTFEFGPSWSVVVNTFAPLFGLIEVRGNGYDAQAQLSQTGERQTTIVVRLHQLPQ